MLHLSSARNVLWLNGASYSKSYYWQPIGSRIWEIDWYQMKDLELCLEVLSRSRQPLRYIRRWISRKPLEIEDWFQRTTNRKWHMGYHIVTWQMTSRDPKRSNLWPPIRLERNISKTVVDRYSVQRTTNRKWPMGIKWSRDRWCHVTKRCCEALRSAILATAWLLVLVANLMQL